jgi:hypothetical protein
MAGFATRPSFAGHAGGSATTNHELTSTMDHLMGAGQSRMRPTVLSRPLIILRCALDCTHEVRGERSDASADTGQ